MQRIHSLNQQQGAVLITALIILAAVTSIAVLGMQKSTTSVRMVGNTKLFENAFNIALSEIDFTFDQYRQVAISGDLETAIQSPQTARPINNDRNAGNAEVARYAQNGLKIESTLTYQGGAVNIDHTFSGANSIGMVKKYTFVITSQATIDAAISANPNVDTNTLGATIKSRQEKEFSFLGRKAN